jgi:hypothetical protein
MKPWTGNPVSPDHTDIPSDNNALQCRLDINPQEVADEPGRKTVNR